MPPRPAFLKQLAMPIIAAPMFLVSGTSLVTAACKQGIVGTFPALNARTPEILDKWLTEIKAALQETPARDAPMTAPFGVNVIVHKTNGRLRKDVEAVIKHQVPIVITSLGAVPEVIEAAIEVGVARRLPPLRPLRMQDQAGADGLIAVCAGAGGHAGVMSPFALVPKLREFYQGPICLAGALSNGASIRAAQVLGADLAYMGTRFIATQESMAEEAYKRMIVDSKNGPAPTYLPVIYTDKISGVNANFLRKSLERAGLDPDNPQGEGLGEEDFSKLGMSLCVVGRDPSCRTTFRFICLYLSFPSHPRPTISPQRLDRTPRSRHQKRGKISGPQAKVC
ncbi:hypothetical protein BDK51DRAFT_15583 [Blyttiomyces helicus]|uniref:Uncharacterized protein n=1 Tax=Blyttiomyces helicus TaxID=388810 RepID=A0A4P9WDN1_9FUNG|nr:hypothetical protein BDK51DRAFT_15583 [Blyttiomyces helicus]|eukprot:RKO90664.1 hypothetical protein BDK51DRAFT_15583 [Blyttiomyces helicus]